MNYRLELAKAALSGILANPQLLIKAYLGDDLQLGYEPEWYAKTALDLADATLDEYKSRERIDRNKRAIR